MKSILFFVGQLYIVLISRIALLLYWACDNIQIITQLKLRKGDQEYWGKMGMLNWTISLVCNLIQLIRQYIQQTTQLKYYRELVATNPEKKESLKDQILKAKKDRVDTVLNIIKTVGDLFPASKGAGKFFPNSGITNKLGLTWINDVWCGLGGSISAAIFLYQIYK